MGLMAGTSGDGIDAACVEITGTGRGMRVRYLWHLHRPFSAALRRRLHAIMAPAATRTEELSRLHTELGNAFADVAHEAIADCPRTQRPQFVGLAGQTVCHLPKRRSHGTVTLQLGEPARVAARTGLITVADFRQGDVAAGGQGAPLVPWTDWILFRHEEVSRAIQNIGGIANVTFLPAGAREEHVIAFDTGPGNMVIDALAGHYSNGRRHMDRNGAMAARGNVHPGLLTEWLKHPFFKGKPPKTTGREMFGQAYVEQIVTQCRRRRIPAEDVLATATAMTVRAIADAYRKHLRWTAVASATAPDRRRTVSESAPTHEVIVTGGGAKNQTLMRMLGAALRPARVVDVGQLGIPVEAKEAVSFAILAAARLDEVAGNLPRVTGAERPARMGAVYLP